MSVTKRDDELHERGLALLKEIADPMAPQLTCVMAALLAAEERGRKRDRAEVIEMVTKCYNGWIKEAATHMNNPEQRVMWKQAALAGDVILAQIQRGSHKRQHQERETMILLLEKQLDAILDRSWDWDILSQGGMSPAMSRVQEYRGQVENTLRTWKEYKNGNG